MTTEIVKKLIEKVIHSTQYKPTWVFALEDYKLIDGKSQWTIHVTCDATCIVNNEPITINRSQVLDMNAIDTVSRNGLVHRLGNKRALLDWIDKYVKEEIARLIEEIEIHEMREYLKFDGKRFYKDVHPEVGY